MEGSELLDPVHGKMCYNSKRTRNAVLLPLMISEGIIHVLVCGSGIKAESYYLFLGKECFSRCLVLQEVYELNIPPSLVTNAVWILQSSCIGQS